MITKLATFSGVAPNGEPLVRVFHKGDSIEKLAGRMMPEVQKWLSGYRPQKNKIAILVNALGSSEYWGQNINGDIFYEDALLHDCRKHPGTHHPISEFSGKTVPPYGYWTFYNAHPFVHHRNKDPSRAFGEVVLACWNPTMHRVELIIMLDRDLAMQHGAQHIVDKIDAGEHSDVSMGCRVPFDVCTICDHKSKTRADYCPCITEFGMGKILDDGRRVGVINTYPRFFDISFVFIGADKTAKVMCKLGSLWVPASVAEAYEVYNIPEGTEGLVKAACGAKSCRECAKGCTIKVASVQLKKTDEVDANLKFGRTDDQEPEAANSMLATNYDDNKESEGGVNIVKNAASLADLFARAKGIKIGSPPKPNRKEYPFVGTINFRGLTIHVENKPGDVREGTDGKGTKWRTNMRLPYGEFVGTRGVDEDKLDVYVGPYRNAPNVHIIHQNHARGPDKGKYDEDKVMVGFESPEQAKAAYLAHYDSPNYFRSITTMAFPLFKKAIQRKEVHGEKVAQEMKKLAQDMRLEDLFNGHRTAQRRERTWSKNGKKTTVIGSGMESSDKAKEAGVRLGKKVWDAKYAPPPLDASDLDELVQEVSESMSKGHKKKASAEAIKLATVLKIGFSPAELLKVSNDYKTASHLKWADIVKKVGPSRAVGKVSPLLSADEPSIPKETLNEMGGMGLEKGLSTPSMMGMVLKPREFQRVCLCGMGKEPLADKLDAAGAVFKPEEQEMAPCSPLGSEHLVPDLLKKLLPLLAGKSYFGPPVRHRIIRITIVKPSPPEKDLEVSSPLLTKVGSAYTWYRREQMKLAADAMRTVVNTPELHAAIYGVGLEDMFSKSAAAVKIPPVNPATLGVLLGSVPLTLMYSAHQRDKMRRGEELGFVNRVAAEHPWLTTLAIGAGLREIMKTPQAQQAVTELYHAGRRIWRGKGAT